MTNNTIPEVNIGLVGHVDHGKTSLTQCLSGDWTDTHSEELRRGITIRIGYADFSMRRCGNDHYTTDEECSACGDATDITRTISLVDAPGHETLMANVLSGAAIMDGAILVIAADEPCPQPQTAEHLEALTVTGIENVVIVQNKVDAVSEERAQEHHQEIKNFVAGTVAEDAPIIPVSALYEANIDLLLEAIEEHVPTPDRDPDADPQMLVARSFDINKPGDQIQDLHGAIAGGSLVQGTISKGDDLVMKPGTEVNGSWEPLETTAASIRHGNNTVDTGSPGGLLAVETDLDPGLAKADGLAGNVLGHPDKLPPTYDTLTLTVNKLDRADRLMEEHDLNNIGENEPLMLIVGAMKTAGVVTQAGNPITVNLKIPVCAREDDTVAIARQIKGRWRLFGYGTLEET